MIKLPLPPSINRAYRYVGTRVYKSPEHQHWANDAGWMVKRWLKGRFYPKDTLVEVQIGFHMGGTSDIDNRIKMVLDMLEGIAYENDKQVMKLNVVKVITSKSEQCLWLKVYQFMGNEVLLSPEAVSTPTIKKGEPF